MLPCLLFSVRSPRWRRSCWRKRGGRRRCSPLKMTSTSCWPESSWLTAEGEVTHTITIRMYVFELTLSTKCHTLHTDISLLDMVTPCQPLGSMDSGDEIIQIGTLIYTHCIASITIHHPPFALMPMQAVSNKLLVIALVVTEMECRQPFPNPVS